jgi:AraC-like DNA-binding protein
LSQVINTYFDSNFSEYINKLRVDEAKKQLKESIQSGKTVLEIVYASGFNSKLNFYTAFKQITEIAPSNYKALIRKKQLIK